MKIKINKELAIKISILFIILLVPWLIMGITSDVQPEKITSDLRFYEINTCEISIIDFLIENPNVIYQDHYKLKFNDYSLMKCFGLITGIDQINHVFYISIGTNTFLNIIYQSLVWSFIFCFIKKNKNFKFSIKFLFSLIFSAILLTLTIYVEERFYVKNVYFYDFNSFQYFIQLLLLILFISFLSAYFIETRQNNIIVYLPFLYLLIGVFSGTNFNYFIAGFLVHGINSLIVKGKFWLPKFYFLFLLLLWGNNAYPNEYYVDPDKLRGFTSSIFTGSSVILYSLIFGFVVNGLIYIFNQNQAIDINQYLRNLLKCSSLILIIGYLGSSIPAFNFFNYYFLGLNKYGINRSNIFGINEWGERLAWRGNYPSAETIGEFFGLGILIFLILILKKQYDFKKFDIVFLSITFFGLYSSNNRAAFLSIFVCLFIFILKEKYEIKYLKYLMIIFLILLFVFLIGLNNFGYSMTYLGESLINDGKYYSSGDLLSSTLVYLIDAKGGDNAIYSIVSILSIFGFFVNRSELWGIFISRFDPEFQELIFGSGLNNFGQLYGEVYINPTYSFLLPHSSFLSYFLFIGILNLGILLLFYITRLIFKYKNNSDLLLYLAIFVILNLLKSDSLLYSSSLINYLFIFYFSIKKDTRLV